MLQIASNEYIYGTVISFVITGIIWLFMFSIHAKINNPYSFGGFFIAIGFLSMSWRCYQYYIVQHKISTPDIMISVFISAATFLSGSIIIAIPYFKNKPKT